jgi:UDP-N-acetylmuramate dehydrogenase
VSTTVEIGPATFAEHTTLRVGGVVGRWIIARSEDACIEAIVECDDIGGDVLIVGGGSNIVCSDAHFNGTVVQVAPTGIHVIEQGGHIRVIAAAGESWDDLVLRSLQEGSGALAPLSGIPGLVGATPIQNVGAYGTEVADVITSVRVWDRRTRSIVDLTSDECEFGYRSSVFKRDADRYLVLHVVYDLPRDENSVINYQQLAEHLRAQLGDAVDGGAVREAVLELRRSKGMVLDEDDPDTWSVGSFFMNPFLDAQQAAKLPDQCPVFQVGDRWKVSAAWLIEHCGVDRGFHLPGSGARVSTKHTLALCNAGNASSADVLELARELRDRVQERFDIELIPEPRLVGCSI